MKRNSFFLLIFFILMPMATGLAQSPVTVLDSLVVEIWPDYDKASVLVLLTGTLPIDTRFPASVTLPLPETAQLNAVARIDSSDDTMKDDIFSSTNPSGTLTFITPDLRFRVEYYLPYLVDNDRRSFDYTWLADIAVNQFQLKVQQPITSGSLKTEPTTENVLKGGDGFDYHIFSPRTVPSGQPFSLHVEYNMTTSQLSVERLPPSNTGIQAPGLPATSTAGTGINWPMVAIVTGGLVIIVVLVWQIASRRPSSNIGKPIHAELEKQSQAKFCHGCGVPVKKVDKYCSECGAALQ
ncbi:MAG TPA: zinc ribbon domain-containing protein [Desulfobacterales bacterium]|nr:zinc ribbon domain-containing protein [Desulfobacterales bacterium]